MSSCKSQAKGMPKDTVLAIARAYLEPMSQALHVAHWDIKLEVKHIASKEGAAAQVFMDNDYHKARIVIDHRECDSEADVCRYLRHELIHLLLGPFDLYADTTREALKGVDGASSLLDVDHRVFTHAVEQAVLNLERVFDFGIKYQPWIHETFEEVLPFPVPATVAA